MSEQAIQKQIDELNAKMDIILKEVMAQRENRQEIVDLVDDLSLVGKDAFKHSVQSLDRAGIELDSEAVGALVLKLVRNIDTFNKMMDTLESANDFVKDASPIVRQVGLDAIDKFAEYERKGYLDFAREFVSITDKIVENYTADDIRELADRMVDILNIIRSLTQAKILDNVDKALKVLNSMETVEEYSLWKAAKAMKSPEMKKTLGFLFTFLKAFYANDNPKEINQ